MLKFEHAFWQSSPAAILAGVDEAGRGPLAGPVFAAAVSMPFDSVDSLYYGRLKGLTDSKKLTSARREFFFELLSTSEEVRIGVGVATVAEIDKLNILCATHLAMRRAVEAIGKPPVDHALVDGLPVNGLPCPSTAIVKGDAKSLLIASASVVAKVLRDRLMLELDAKYPGYGFADNKGYGTAKHLSALRQIGLTPEHRHSFAPVAALLGNGANESEEIGLT